jgi:oligoribonuclease
MSEPARSPGRLSKPIGPDQRERRLFDADDNQLGNAVSSGHGIVVDRVVIYQNDLELTPVSGVNETGCVEASHAVTEGQAAARENEAGVAVGDGHGNACRYECSPSPGQKDDVVPCHQICSGVAWPSIRRYAELRIELMEGYLQHRWTLQAMTSPFSTPRTRTSSIPPMLAWIDLEMTGLEPSRHVIVEIASLITDNDLQIVAEGPDLVVQATPEQLAEMDDFVISMHTRSGLLGEITASTMSLEEAGAKTLEFLKLHVPEARTVPLAGNSIGTDRRFLATQLPEIEEYLHYRSVDVSTVKELCRRWYPEVYKTVPTKKGGHRALQDIRESVAELAFYRTAIFNPASRGPSQ